MKRRNWLALLVVVVLLALVAAPAAAAWLTRFNSVLIEHDLEVDGDTTLNTLTVSGATNLGSTSVGASQVFEGATADDYETTLTATDPTADRTITMPNATGTVMLSSLTTNAPDAANGVWGASNGLVFEGATGGADAYETTITPADPTADQTVTLANASGTVMLSSLATNAPDVANSVWGASNGLVFEGATGGADAYETTITPTDPTADRTITIPNATGTLLLGSGATTAVMGITSTFTGTITVTHGLTTVIGAIGSLCQDSAAAAASASISISGATVIAKAWKADGATAADAGTTVCYIVYGTP